MVVDLIVFIIIGAIIGALARLVIPGRQNISVLMTVVLGVVGALIGGYIARAITDSRIIYYIISIAVAALLVYLYSSMGARNRTRI